jgi:tetratricopeptide (TPR) repeat protein
MRKRAATIAILSILCWPLVRSARGDSMWIYRGQMAPGPTAGAINAGILAVDSGDFTKAELSYQQALKIKPNEPHALILLADLAIRRGKPAQALPYLRTAVDKNPQSAAAQEAMGRYLADQKDFPGAQSALEKSVQLDPKWIVARISLGDFYLARGKPADALSSYLAGVGIDSNSPDAHYSLGKGLESTGDVKAAEGEYRTALRLAPNSALSHIALGDLLGRTARTDAAIAEYETAANLAPKSGEPQLRIGMAYQVKGRSDLAEQAYREAVALQPNLVVALNNLAWIDLQKPQKLDEALTFAKKTVELVPSASQFQDTLGWVYHVKGDNQQAVVTLRKGITLSPKDPEIHYHLAVVYQDLKKPQDALSEVNTSLSLNKDFPEKADAQKLKSELNKAGQ